MKRAMKKLLLILLLFSIQQTQAQNPTYQQKLFYTCKVWGFVKYFHSGVSTCSVNWDSILVSRLPAIKNAVTNSDFNNELGILLTAAGPMTLATTSLPDTIPAALKRNRDFAWINDPILRTDVKAILDTIKNNFRPHASCWVKDNKYTNSYNGWLVFPHDSLMLTTATYQTYPDERTRLLLGFKYWNIMHYFNPYNYVLDTPSDSSLYEKILLFASAPDAQTFNYALRKIAKDLDDAHVQGYTYSFNYGAPTYRHAPQIILRYLQNKYIVVSSKLSSIKPGDAILSINGYTTASMEDSLRPYLSAGNPAVFHRFMCRYLLNGDKNTQMDITYSDNAGNSNTLTATRNDSIHNPFFFSYYPSDTLATVKWKKFACGTGYVNMGQLQQLDVNIMYGELQDCPAIIFDIRNYPNATAFGITNLIYPNKKMFAKLMIPSVNYPGTFYWQNQYAGSLSGSFAYTGKIIILINQETQSQAEYTSMMIGNMSNAITIGSQTAGADGNVSYFGLAPDLKAGFTSLGVFYPNGDSTQRIGIRPDTVIYPTPAGIRQNRDEVLEKALKIADCATGVDALHQDHPSVMVYPNPASRQLFIETNASGSQIIDLFDVNGKQVLNKNINRNVNLDVSMLKEGVYLLRIRSDETIVNKRVVIVR
jgi:carboxyl-terminal processing protease